MVTAAKSHPLSALWVYTLLRFLLFVVLFGILWALGLRGLLGAAVAVVLSVPLSYVLLSRPRARLAEGLNAQFKARRMRTQKLDVELSGQDEDERS